MPTLTIRNLPDTVYRRLRVRAAHAGRSLEAEVRDILGRAEEMPRAKVDEPDPVAALQAYIDQSYKEHGRRKPRNVVDAFIRERRREAKRELKE